MRRILLLGLIAPAVGFGVLAACTGDDEAFRPTDGGSYEASTVDSPTTTPTDASVPGLACGDAAGAPPRVLLIQGSRSGSELAAVNLATSTVDGRLAFDGGYGVTSSLGSDPYLLAEEADTVTRLDAREPWKAVATWDVRGDDGYDGGMPNANPVGVVQTSCNKAYVLRYNRNKIAVIDPSIAKGGTATKYVDLSSLKQAADPDVVEVTAGVYIPSKKRVYVLLGNADFSKFDVGSSKLVCADLKPSIIAIDADTDQIVSLGGAAPGGGIALEGYNPVLGSPLVYDAAFDRLLVLQGGCNADQVGGPGDMARRSVEQVDLATGAVKTALPLDDNGFPSTLAFVSGDQAAVAFGFEGYHWDPHQTTLGDAIFGGIDFVATDGRGAFVGSHQTYFADSGAGPLEILSVPLTDAGPTVVTTNPFTKAGGYVSGIEAWPHP